MAEAHFFWKRAFIKMSGKTSELYSGDESEYLILPLFFSVFCMFLIAYSICLWYNKDMRKLNKSRHSRYLLNLHIVWIPKYRRAILNGHQDEMKDILHSIAENKQWEILAVEVMPDHVHLFVSVPPTIAPCEVVKAFKGQSGRHFLMNHPEFADVRYDNSLWAPSYFVASAGDVSSEIIKAYIEGQYD